MAAIAVSEDIQKEATIEATEGVVIEAVETIEAGVSDLAIDDIWAVA